MLRMWSTVRVVSARIRCPIHRSWTLSTLRTPGTSRSAAAAALRDVPGVRSVDSVQLRWIGHRMRAETTLTVDHILSIVEAHAIADEAHHQLIHRVPRLDDATIHVNPAAQH